MAPESILPGEQWADAIARVIPESQIMILLWTNDSMKSRQVINELTLADRSGVMVIPFRLEDIQPEGAFKYYLFKTHWLDAIDNAWRSKLELLGQRVVHNLPSESNLIINDGQPINPKIFWQPFRFAILVILAIIMLPAALFLLSVKGKHENAATAKTGQMRPTSSSIDQAVLTIQKIYQLLTDKKVLQAKEFFEPELSQQITDKFYAKFDRVSIENLKVTGTVGSTVNLAGVVTFVWPDGSVQKESRTFSVNTNTKPAIVTATEFGEIIRSR